MLNYRCSAPAGNSKRNLKTIVALKSVQGGMSHWGVLEQKRGCSTGCTTRAKQARADSMPCRTLLQNLNARQSDVATLCVVHCTAPPNCRGSRQISTRTIPEWVPGTLETGPKCPGKPATRPAGQSTAPPSSQPASRLAGHLAGQPRCCNVESLPTQLIQIVTLATLLHTCNPKLLN